MMAISTSSAVNSYTAYGGAQAKTAQPAPASPDSTAASSGAGSGAAGSADAPLSQVVTDARAALDAGYQRLGHAGDTCTTGAEWRKTVGLDSLDRQTLFAISSNQGGQFSKVEQDAASFIMTQQQAQVMTDANPTGQDSAAAYKAAIDFLDQASPEEKGSLQWAQQRAAAQAGYLLSMKNAGQAADNVDSGNPLVNLFVHAYDELFATGDTTQSVQNMPSWKKAMDMWNKLHGKGSTVSVTA